MKNDCFLGETLWLQWTQIKPKADFLRSCVHELLPKGWSASVAEFQSQTNFFLKNWTISLNHIGPGLISRCCLRQQWSATDEASVKFLLGCEPPPTPLLREFLSVFHAVRGTAALLFSSLSARRKYVSSPPSPSTLLELGWWCCPATFTRCEGRWGSHPSCFQRSLVWHRSHAAYTWASALTLSWKWVETCLCAGLFWVWGGKGWSFS